MKLTYKLSQRLNQIDPNTAVEEREIDSVICWFSHDKQCFIPYTAEELTEELMYIRKAIDSL